MSYAITEDHRALQEVARDFLVARDVVAAHRATLAVADDCPPEHWAGMAELGWFGLHLPEESGGQGYGIAELAVVLFELGYAVAPGPFLPTVVASSLIASAGSDAQRAAHLQGLAGGSTPAAFGLEGDLRRDGDTVSGSAGLVLGAELADLLVLVAGDDVVLIDAEASGVTVDTVPNLDTSRRVARVSLDGVHVADDRVIAGGARELVRLARILGSAETAGTARACLDMAVDYAKERMQFGRVIGSFQAVKHLCADMLVASEQATASVWGAARDDVSGDEAHLGAAVAAAVTLPAAVACAENNVQVLGGIGFTWEHDAHLYLRRANAIRGVLGGAGSAQELVMELAAEGVTARTGFEIVDDVQALRDELRSFIAANKGLPADQWRIAVADAGFLMPHWPEPYGRAAGPVEQLVIDEEFAEHPRPDLGISGWNTLTILQSGDDDQIERWIWPSLHGELDFCQLYSEPEAGSDAAGVKTRAMKVDGGWKVTGQKVWTSGGHTSNRGFATVRTNPDAPKHQGISMMVIDMAAEGVEIRPLRQITGESHFCEVFFDEVFVPDDDVVGPVDGGWAVARSNLGNERVSIGGRGGSRPLPNIVQLVTEHACDDVAARREAGAIVASDVSMDLLNLRRVARAVEGAEPGAEGNVTKLVGSITNQMRARAVADVVGSEAATFGDGHADPGFYSLFVRQNSIAGGTSEIIRSQIGERVLGLPREPNLR